MTAIYTFDGFGSYDGGDWGGYWGKQGPGFLDRRPGTEESAASDPVNARMRSLPTPSTSSPGSRRSPTCRCARRAACR